jgi:hypothetical protein
MINTSSHMIPLKINNFKSYETSMNCFAIDIVKTNYIQCDD